MNDNIIGNRKDTVQKKKDAGGRPKGGDAR